MASAGCVDARSVKGADTVGAAVRGFDAGKKVNGRKRHIVVDTMGLLLLVVITSAGVQDRDGARTLVEKVKMAMPWLALLWGRRRLCGQAGRMGRARRPHHDRDRAQAVGIKTFQVLPRRWVVERTFAWIVKWRRLDQDYERLPQTSEAMIKWAMIGLMVRRLEPAPGRKPWQKASTAAWDFPNTFLEQSSLQIGVINRKAAAKDRMDEYKLAASCTTNSRTVATRSAVERRGGVGHE
jgi:transposase